MRYRVYYMRTSCKCTHWMAAHIVRCVIHGKKVVTALASAYDQKTLFYCIHYLLVKLFHSTSVVFTHAWIISTLFLFKYHYNIQWIRAKQQRYVHTKKGHACETQRRFTSSQTQGSFAQRIFVSTLACSLSHNKLSSFVCSCIPNRCHFFVRCRMCHCNYISLSYFI